MNDAEVQIIENLIENLPASSEEQGNEWFSYLARNGHERGLISRLSRTQTDRTTHLCIPSLSPLLLCGKEFQIGGTYTGDKQDFWFFGSASVCHGYNYLLKLFLVARKHTQFSVHMPSNGNDLTGKIKIQNNRKCAEIAGPKKEFVFANAHAYEIIYLMTYNFTKENLERIGDFVLLLPCSIEIHTKLRINPDIVRQIKLQYSVELNEALFRSRSEGDFILESSTNTKHPVHLVAAAHSTVLKEALKQNKKSYSLNMNDEDVETLIEFLYKGSVSNLSPENASKILELGDKMGLPGMLQLAQLVLSINVYNAVDVSLLAKRYKLDSLLLKAFNFIKQNPAILLSNSIENLHDTDLMRSMLRHVGNSLKEEA